MEKTKKEMQLEMQKEIFNRIKKEKSNSSIKNKLDGLFEDHSKMKDFDYSVWE